MNNINYVAENIDFYTNQLNRYKTTSAKKAFVTRSLKHQQQWLNDIKEAVDKHKGWFLGVIYTSNDIHIEQQILDGIKKLYTLL